MLIKKSVLKWPFHISKIHLGQIQAVVGDLGSFICYYKQRQQPLEIGAAFVVTNHGKIIISRSRTITNRDSHYKFGQLLQIGAQHK